MTLENKLNMLLSELKPLFVSAAAFDVGPVGPENSACQETQKNLSKLTEHSGNWRKEGGRM